MTVHPQRALFRRTCVAAACASTLAHCVSEPGELFSDVEMYTPPPGGEVPGVVPPSVAAAPAGAGAPSTPSEVTSPAPPLDPGAASAPVAPSTGTGGDSDAENGDPSASASEDAAAAAEGVPVAPGEPQNPDPPPAVVDADPTGGARVCPPPAQALLLDFDVPGNVAGQGQFGDFTSVLSGGTFVYPLNAAASATEPFAAFGLSSDVSEGDWHVQGAVRTPAGFGLFFDCELLDASSFIGIAFRIQGSVALGQELTFFVNDASHEVSRTWLIQEGGSSLRSFGRCFPADSEFDGSCVAPRIVLPITVEPTEVFVPFTALTNGSPEATLNPAEITDVQWALPVPAADEAGIIVPYAVDLVIDEIRFVEAE